MSKLYLYIIFFIFILSNLFSKTINVKNGDSYEQINKIIEMAESYDVILFEDGIYVVDYTFWINNKKNLTIKAENKASIECRMYASVFYVENCSNLTIENFHLYHTEDAEAACADAHVLSIYDSKNITVKNCELNGCGEIGVYSYNSDDIKITNCYIHSNISYGIYITTYDESENIENVDLGFRYIIEDNIITGNENPVFFLNDLLYEDESNINGLIMIGNNIYNNGEYND